MGRSDNDDKHGQNEREHSARLSISIMDPAFQHAVKEVIKVLEKHSKIYAKSSNTCECTELVFAHAVVSTILVKIESVVTVIRDEFDSEEGGHA